MKSFFKKLLPFLSLFLLVSCSNGVSKASLLISVGNSTARGAKEDLAKVGLTFESFEYVIDVTYPDNFVFEKTVRWGDSLSLDVFDQGYYSVQVKACLPNVVEFLRENMDDGITEQILAEELGKYESYKDLPLYKGVQTKYVSAHGVTPFSIKLKLTPFFGGEDESDRIDEKIEKIIDDLPEFSFFIDAEKVDNKYRHRASIPLTDVLEGKKLSEGDTVVFTVSGTIGGTGFDKLGAQLVNYDSNTNKINTYGDQVNEYINLGFGGGTSVNIKIPMNFITLQREGKDVELNYLQLFFDDDDTEVVQWTNTEIKVNIYPASSRTLQFGKDWGYDINGNKTQSYYRDVIKLKIPGEYFQENILKAGEKLKITVDGACNKNCEISCVLFDEDPEIGYWHEIANNPQTIRVFEEGFESNCEFSITNSSSSNNKGRISLQLYVQGDYEAGKSFLEDLFITDFNIKASVF